MRATPLACERAICTQASSANEFYQLLVGCCCCHCRCAPDRVSAYTPSNRIHLPLRGVFNALHSFHTLSTSLIPYFWLRIRQRSERLMREHSSLMLMLLLLYDFHSRCFSAPGSAGFNRTTWWVQKCINDAEHIRTSSLYTRALTIMNSCNDNEADAKWKLNPPSVETWKIYADITTHFLHTTCRSISDLSAHAFAQRLQVNQSSASEFEGNRAQSSGHTNTDKRLALAKSNRALWHFRLGLFRRGKVVGFITN